MWKSMYYNYPSKMAADNGCYQSPLKWLPFQNGVSLGWSCVLASLKCQMKRRDDECMKCLVLYGWSVLDDQMWRVWSNVCVMNEACPNGFLSHKYFNKPTLEVHVAKYEFRYLFRHCLSQPSSVILGQIIRAK